MTAVTVRGPLTIGGTNVRCPGRGVGSIPRQLTLMASGQTVMATCGEKHRIPGQRLSRKAQCFFPVDGIAPATLAVLARGKPGKFRLTLPDGQKIEGTLAEPAKGATATGKAAAAVAAKTGKPTKAAPAKPTPAGKASGGSFAAACNAIAAIAGAAGQTAAAAGAAVSSTAGAAGKMADLGREGIRVADNRAARRFAASNTENSGPEPEGA